MVKNSPSLKKFSPSQKNSQKNKKEFFPFPIKLPPRLAKKIKKHNFSDPIYRQFIPSKEEKEQRCGFEKDPLQEKEFQNGLLLQKYDNRALLLCSNNCAMHCRFCFRKHLHFPKEGLEQTVAAIEKETSLSEVILSGGDPLSLTNPLLEKLLFRLDKISHLRRIRFHSRFLIAFPERIDKKLISILSQMTKKIFFVLHTNHERELDADLFTALEKLQRIKIPILTQTVLLKGVNDNFSALFSLFSQLIDHGILPYYLHQLDRVAGSFNFWVDIAKGKELLTQLRKKLPGYAIPQYVQEIAKEKSKTPL